MSGVLALTASEIGVNNSLVDIRQIGLARLSRAQIMADISSADILVIHVKADNVPVV